MASYLVIACPRCRKARVVEEGRKSTTCGSCGRTLDLRDLQAQAQTDSMEEAREAAGRVNAKLAGRLVEFEATLIPVAPRGPSRHEDPYDAAAAAARKATSQKDRVDALSRGLAQAAGSFTRDELRRAFGTAALPEDKLDAHLKRMLATSVLYEPRPGVYRAF